jgi:hypothetical protein
MNRIIAVAVPILVMFATGICQADSLVITYKSGKTQTVVLDEPSQVINSWQFVSGPVSQEQIQKNPVVQLGSNSKPADKAPEKKSGVRVKWNAKPIPD